MKIGIISFHTADNHGAVLQNFSLQKSLVKIGYNADTIDYQDQHIIENIAYKRYLKQILNAFLMC